MKTKKNARLLCIDFEYIDFIYNPITYRNPWIDMTVVNRPEAGLVLLKDKSYDAIITTIVTPGMFGITFIEDVQKHPELYGRPLIAVLTGLGGKPIVKALEKLNVDYIPRFAGFDSMTDDDLNQLKIDVDKFLNKLPQSPKHSVNK